MKFVGLLFILYLLWSVVESNNETCYTQEYETVTYNLLNYSSTKTQSFQIGILGSFGIHYDRIWLLYKTAIDVINNDYSILPNVRLEANVCELKDVDVNTLIAMESMMQFKNVRAFVSPFELEETKIALLLAQVFKVPQVVSLQIESILSATSSFMARVIPSDAIQARAIADFAYTQKWRQLMVVYSNNIRSISALQELQMTVAKFNISIYPLQVPSNLSFYPRYIDDLGELVSQYRLRIFVHLTVFSDAISLFPFLTEAGYVGDPKYAHILCFDLTSSLRADPILPNWAIGSVGLAPLEAHGPRYEEFLQIWNTQQSEPGWLASPGVLWYIVDALWVIVYSLDKIIQRGVALDDITGPMHLESMRDLHFLGITGEVKLDTTIQRIGGYNWYNFKTNSSRIEAIAEYNELNSKNTNFFGPVRFYQGSEFVYDGSCMCKFGSCEGEGPTCTCHEGFSGLFCELRKNSFPKWLLAIIIVVPFVSCLIIAIYAYRCVQTKRAMAIKDVTDRQRSVIRRSDITINQTIGKGASGVVCRGMLRGTEVAIKRLVAHDVSINTVQAFELESAVMAGLRHPNIVLFMGSCFVPEDNEMLLVMEYMEKGSLHDILHNPNVDFPFELALHIAIQAAKGMNFLHESSPPIIHRDLKSHNILLDDKWNARIADFGIARIKDISNSKKGKGDQAIGTVFWTAPEIFLGQSNTEKSDCYSFGIVLWELVHRENPYNEKDVMTVAYEVSRKGLRLPITASVPPRYKELIENCWDASPERRPSFHHVAQTLRQLAHAHPLTHFRAHAHSLAHSCDSASVVFVRTRVRASCTLWDSVPGGMLHSMTMHNQLLRSLLGSYEGYEVAFENDKGEGEKEREGFLFAFEGVGSALNFCLNVQIALLQVTWPPSILSFPAASVVFKSVGRKLWSGLRVRMSIHSGTCSSSFDHVSGRTKYFGSAVDKTHHILRAAPKWASIIVSETIMQKINTNNIKSTEDIKCDACGIMVDSNKKQEHLYSVLPLSLSSRSNFYTELSVVGPNGETDEEVISPFEEPEEDHLPWTIPFSSIVLKENIGRGPIGDYFRATWKNKEVAVKELINQKLQESDILYLKSKISNLCKLKHKNVVEVFGVCFEVGHISVVTEYIPGNLRQVLNNDFVPLTWKTKLRIAHQIAEGMSYLVEHPDPDIYIHENLKSGNIHVNVDRGVVKISDHGQGVLRDLARTMTSVDNIAWTAPEILRGESATAAISIYSFGIILFEIATRREPYTDEHPVMLVEKVLEGFRPSGAPQCPPGYQELMEECWDSNPDNRPTWSYCAHTLGGILAQNKN